MPQIAYTFSKNDEWYTPAYAVYPIIRFLKPNSVIWCPFDTAESEFVKVLKKHNFKVIFTHIISGGDFFTAEVPDCDYIISNPPYSKKTEVLFRLFEIGKPFAMLINLQGIFDSRDRFKLFKENQFEMLWLSPRVNFIKQSGASPSGVPFQSGYICSRILDHQLEFEYLDRSLT